MESITFTYGDFYDFPRSLWFVCNGHCYYYRSMFDESKDAYPDQYEVYQFHPDAIHDPYFWMNVENAVYIGKIAATTLGFDATRRKTISAHMFKSWLASR